MLEILRFEETTAIRTGNCCPVANSRCCASYEVTNAIEAERVATGLDLDRKFWKSAADSAEEWTRIGAAFDEIFRPP